MRGKLGRVVVGLSLITFLAGISARGLCFMKALPPGTGSHSGSEHDCCKTGLQAFPPGCCMQTRIKDRDVDASGLETLVVLTAGDGTWKVRHSHTSSRRRPTASPSPAAR